MIEGDLFQDTRQKEKTDLKSVLSNYLQYWYLFVIAIAICIGIAFFHIRYTVTKYYVGSTMLVKDQADGGFALNTGASEMDMFKPTKNIDDEIIVLKSKSLMERVLSELSLNASYFLEGRVQDLEVYEKDLPLKLIIHELNHQAFGRKVFIYPKENNFY